MKDLFKFTIPGKPEYVQMVRLAIGSIAGQAGFDIEKVDDITLSVSEACKNITCHGHEGFSNCYEVMCELTEASMLITVEDTSCSHDIVKNCKPCASCPNEGNLAVDIIRSLMDRVEENTSSDGKKKIVMEKNR